MLFHADSSFTVGRGQYAGDLHPTWGGLFETGAIFFLTLVLSMPLGLLVAFGRMSKIKPLSWLTRFFISVMRGTPLMLQLMVVYFAPGFLIVKLNWEVTLPDNYRFIATIVGFVLNYAAYFAEIYRGGIESMPVGQYEAAQVLGFTRSQTFLRIILPQVAKNILPSVTNEIHYAGEGYLSCLLHFRCGDVYGRKDACHFAILCYPILCCRRVLLHRKLCGLLLSWSASKNRLTTINKEGAV